MQRKVYRTTGHYTVWVSRAVWLEEVSWQKASSEYPGKRAALPACSVGLLPFTTPGGTAIWFPQPTPHLTKEPQGWGLSFTGAFVTGMELKKLLSSGPSHFFEYPSTQSFLQGPFEESRLLSYICPVAATNLQTDLWILSSPKASFSPSTKTNK